MTNQLTQEVAEKGYAKVSDIGGQPKCHYWTPDGRELWVAPSIREYVRRDTTGKVIQTGVRDANLDKGWLLEKPATLKLYCPHCDLWHDTPKGVEDCLAKRSKIISQSIINTEKQPDSRLDKLESEMAEIKNMLSKLLAMAK